MAPHLQEQEPARLPQAAPRLAWPTGCPWQRQDLRGGLQGGQGMVAPNLSDPRATPPAPTVRNLLDPRAEAPPRALTMQLYSSSSISFTFRQYDCGDRRGWPSERLRLLGARPDVPSSPHATQPRSHPGEQRCRASGALQTPGGAGGAVREDSGAGERRGPSTSRTLAPAWGGPGGSSRGRALTRRVEGPEGQPTIYQTQGPTDALGQLAPGAREACERHPDVPQWRARRLLEGVLPPPQSFGP